MKRALFLVVVMTLIWSGAEGQGSGLFKSDFETGDAAEEWSSVVDGSEDQPPVIQILAPTTWSCEIYLDKRTCNDQFLCKWNNRRDVCVPNEE